MKALEKPVLVIYLERLSRECCGIVAGRIREKYYRPAYVLTDGEKRTLKAQDVQSPVSYAAGFAELSGNFDGIWRSCIGGGFSLPKRKS